MPVIICNIGYGNGPLLRALEVAEALSALLLEETGEQPNVVVPIVYPKQKSILRERGTNTPWLIEDVELGNFIASVSFANDSYEEFLRQWADRTVVVGQSATEYVKQTYGDDCIEIARAPLLDLQIKKKYCMSFGRTSDILKKALKRSDVTLDLSIATNAADLFAALENSYTKHIFTMPSTLDPCAEDSAVPMTMPAPKASNEKHSGLYVTVSGIPNTERLLGFVSELGLPLWSNDPDRLPGSTYAAPSVLMTPGLHAHVARGGWGSIWLSLLSGVPLLMAPHDPNDDPEIAFNIERVEALGIGMAYRKEEPKILLRKLSELRPHMEDAKKELQKKFGALNGAKMAAKIIAKDL